MMALLWDTAFFFQLCAALNPGFPISGWASQIQGGELPRPGAPSAREQGCPDCWCWANLELTAVLGPGLWH